MTFAAHLDDAPGSNSRAIKRWAKRRSGSEPLSEAIGLAVQAEVDGHACVRLDIGDADLIRAHQWVGDGDEVTPCVLTGDRDFFLWRNWRHEERIAKAVCARVDAAQTVDPATLQADLDFLFASERPEDVAGQRRAAQAAIGKRLFVLSGGPGTGKTTTVLSMLLLLQRQAARSGLSPLSIALAAPTGKAAQRLSQALREGKADIQARLSSAAGDASAWTDVLLMVPETAQTLHRLLGFQPHLDRFRYDAENPLPHAIVVIDEASMVDLALMRAALDALAAGAMLILLGDPDQLVSVSAGSVLSDLVGAGRADPSGIGTHWRELTYVWRAEGELAEIYAAVRRGDYEQLHALLTGSSVNVWHRTDDFRAVSQRLDSWLARPEWLTLHAAARLPLSDAKIAFAALRRLQLLTALREGPFGAAHLSAQIDAHWRQRNGDLTWYPGRTVLIRHNDYARRLFNGDIGLAIGTGATLRVYFETVDTEGKPGIRSLSPRELPDHDLAYAITVHKSQGSEYGHVAVLLPPNVDNPILTRQLLYTAVSRAKRSVELWSGEGSLRAALERVGVRNGALVARLTEAVHAFALTI